MAHQRSPQNQQTLNKALSLFQSGRPDKAEKLARSVLSTEPRNAELLQFVAMLCQTQDKFADAAALCTKAVAIAPNSAEAHYNLGTALMKQGRSEQAIASFEKSLALAPGNYDVLNNLAVALTAADRLAEAEAMARRAIAMAPNAPFAHNTLALALTQQMRSAEAVESFKAALACGHPDAGTVLEKLGLVFISLGRPKSAIDSFRGGIGAQAQGRRHHAETWRTADHQQAAAWRNADLSGRRCRSLPAIRRPWRDISLPCLHASEWAEHARLVAKGREAAEQSIARDTAIRGALVLR